MNKEDLRPFYNEFRGYLAQAPNETHVIYESSFWEHYNDAVGLLQKITSKDYSRFLIRPERGQNSYFVKAITYRQKLGGIIMALHGEYFSDETDPLGMGPSTVISQTQQQSQSVMIQILLDVQSKLDENIPKYKEGTKENGFLQKVKGSLSGVSNVVQLINLLLKTAKDLGLSIEDVGKMFGL